MSNSDFLTDTASNIDPSHLAEVTRAVLPYLGTYSITAVKRASKGCEDVASLVSMVASQISDEAQRARFTEASAALVKRLKTPNSGFRTVSNTSGIKVGGGRPPSPITPEHMARGERALAHIIGPLASVLVARYAKSAENSRQFFELLASHIRNHEERQSFFDVIRAESR